MGEIKYQEDHFNFKGNIWEKGDNHTMIGKDAKNNLFIIDEDDYFHVKSYCWSVSSRFSKKGSYFCARLSRKDGHQMVMLHNFIWQIHYGEIPNNCLIDHINQLPQDNRLSNLRLANKSINSINTDIRANNTSGVTGVSYSKRDEIWRSYLTYNGKGIEFSCSKTKEEAIRKRLQGELKYFGELAPQKDLFEEYNIW